MNRSIFLDSGPLGLVTQRVGVKAADDCRRWVEAHIATGDRFIVPEIVDYELRRELLRAGKAASVRQLNDFITAVPGRFMPLHTGAMRLAAELWADLRNKGLPTAHSTDIDVDVIIAAQALTAGLPQGGFLVATSNKSHLSRLMPAELWNQI